jgi:hypothetical protein
LRTVRDESSALDDLISLSRAPLLTLIGPDKNSYYHEKFLRGRPELAQTIPRISIKGKGPRRASDFLPPDPDFYALPFLPSPSASAGPNAPIVQETVAAANMDSSMSGYAAMDPTRSMVTDGTLLHWQQLRLQAALQHEQQELQRQQQWRTQLLLSAAAAEQDRIRHASHNSAAALSPMLGVSHSNNGSAAWPTPQLLDVSLCNNVTNAATTTIGRRALALATVRTAMNVQSLSEPARYEDTGR